MMDVAAEALSTKDLALFSNTFNSQDPALAVDDHDAWTRHTSYGPETHQDQDVEPVPSALPYHA